MGGRLEKKAGGWTVGLAVGRPIGPSGLTYTFGRHHNHLPTHLRIPRHERHVRAALLEGVQQIRQGAGGRDDDGAAQPLQAPHAAPLLVLLLVLGVFG